MLRETYAAPRRRASNDDCWRSIVPTSTRSAFGEHRAADRARKMVDREFSSRCERRSANRTATVEQCIRRRDHAALKRFRACSQPHRAAAFAGLRCLSHRLADAATPFAEFWLVPVRSDGFDRPERMSGESEKPSSRNGTSARVVLLGDACERVVKALGVLAPVIRRHPNADHYDACPRCLAGANHRRQIVLHASNRQSAQAVVAAEFDDDDRRPMLLQQRRQACASTTGGVTADAGIDDRIIRAALLQSICEQLHPPLAAL